jgi:hypothetical protein
MHLSIYLEPVLTVKARQQRMYTRMVQDYKTAVAAAEADGAPVPAREDFVDQSKLSGVDAHMIKVPILYVGMHKALESKNTIKNIKFLEISPLTAFLHIEEALRIVAHLVDCTRQIHDYHLRSGIEERTVMLPTLYNRASVLGVDAGIRCAPTGPNMARLTLLMLDGMIVDYARQHGAALPAQYVDVLRVQATVKVLPSQIDGKKRDAEADAAGKPVSDATDVAVANEEEDVEYNIVGSLNTAERIPRDRKWALKQTYELTSEQLCRLDVPERIKYVEEQHQRQKRDNILARFFTNNQHLLPEDQYNAKASRMDVLETYMDLARIAGDPHSLEKALVLWRSTTRLLEWMHTRAHGDLYIDFAHVRQQMESVSSHEEFEETLARIDRERAIYDGVAPTLEASPAKGKKGKGKDWTKNYDPASGAAHKQQRAKEEQEAHDMVKDYIKMNSDSQAPPEDGGYDMNKRLEGIEKASHVPISPSLQLAAVDLLQAMSRRELNLINAALPHHLSSHCYSDEATAIWTIASRAMMDARIKAVEDPQYKHIDFGNHVRTRDEMIPEEVHASKVAEGTLFSLLLEQCIPTAKNFAKKALHYGVMQPALMREAFANTSMEDISPGSTEKMKRMMEDMQEMMKDYENIAEHMQTETPEEAAAAQARLDAEMEAEAEAVVVDGEKRRVADAEVV